MSSIESTLLFGSSRLRNIENQAQTLIEVAEANIQRLTTQIDELARMRERERSVLARLRLMVLPIGRLPVEVLVEVFKIVVHSPLSFESPWDPSWVCASTESGSALQKVLDLSHVSPHWRQIVHSTPRLWAEAVVGAPFERELTDRYFDGLDSLLARSSPLPISVSIIGDSNTSTIATKSSRRLARSLAPTARRWKNLQIALDYIPHLQDLPRGTFEMLERLHVHNSRSAGPGGDPTLVFESSPHLHRLTVYSDYMTPTLHLLRLPWSQLTHLDVRDMSLEGCRTALLQCSSLVWAKIATTYDWNSASPADQSPVIALPFLDSLDLEFQGKPDFEQVHGVEAFFSPLALPSLKRLKIELDIEDDFWPTAVFTEFQGRSPNIEDFSLGFSDIGRDEFITLLRHSPALRSLEIRSSLGCVDNDFLNAFRCDDEDFTPLVPKLENLTLTDIGSFDNAPLEVAIRSRWWKEEGRVLPDGSNPRVSRLKTVSVTDTDDQFDDNFKDRMQELIDEGLQLVLD